MKKIFVVMFSVSLLFLSCKKDNDTTPNPDPGPSTPVTNATFEFLNVGNKWTYDYDLFLSGSGICTQEIKSLYNSKYRVVTLLDADTFSVADWFSQGPYLKTLEVGENIAKAIFKDNPNINDTWSNPGSSNNTVYYKVVKLNDTVTTTYGQFYDCVKIEVTFSDAFNTQYNYWSKKYGLVYQDGLFSLNLTDKNF